MEGEDNLATSCSCNDCDSLSCFEIRKYLNYKNCSCIKCETPITCLYAPRKEYKYIEKTPNVIVLEDDTESEIKTITPEKKFSQRQFVNERICIGDNNEEIKTICADVSDTKDKITCYNSKEIHHSNDITHSHSTTVTYSRKTRNDSAIQLTAQVMNVPIKEIKYSIFTKKSVISVKFEKQDLNGKEIKIHKGCDCKLCKCVIKSSIAPQDKCKCERCDCEISPEDCKCETCHCETTQEGCACDACDCETNQEDCKCERCACALSPEQNIKKEVIKDIELILPDSFSYRTSNSSSCDEIKEYKHYEISSGVEYETPTIGSHGPQKEFKYVEKTPNVIELIYDGLERKTMKPVDSNIKEAPIKQTQKQISTITDLCDRQREFEYVQKTPNIIELKKYRESGIKSNKLVINTQEQERVKDNYINLAPPPLYSCHNINSPEVKTYGNWEICACVEYEIPNTGVHGREKEFKYIEKTPNVIELEYESELEVEPFKPMEMPPRKENIGQETVKGDKIEQIIIIYKDVSHTKEKNDSNNKTVESNSRNVTHVQSMIITSSHKTSNDSAVKLAAQVMNVPIDEIKQYISSRKSPKDIKLQKQDLYNKVKEIYKACSCKICKCKITSSKIPPEHCKCETCDCGTTQEDCKCDTCNCETTQEDCKCQTCNCGTTQDEISGAKTGSKEFTTPLSYPKSDSPAGIENRKHGNYLTCSCIDCPMPITCLYSPQKEVKYIEKTPNVIELEDVIESEIKSIKPVNNNLSEQTVEKTREGDSNGQVKIMYTDVSHSREKIYYKNKDESHYKNITRVHSMTVTYSRKASNDSATKLAAQIMNVPIKEMKHSTSRKSHTHLQKKDIYSKIKEIYKACSCKVCECKVSQKHCKCVTCNCENDALNINDKKTHHEGCPCIQCDRKDCKGVVKNIDLSSSCDCEPCDCLKCAESINKPCDCAPCHCIECNFLTGGIKNNNISAPVVSSELQNFCKCDPCECLNCALNHETIAPSNLDDTDIGIKKGYRCDNNCGHECHNNKSMQNETVTSTREYDIHRALVSETSAFYKTPSRNISCDINDLDTDPYTFSNKQINCHDKCKCQDCECIACEDKTSFSGESDFNKDNFFSSCLCTFCECQICCKMKSENKIRLKEHTQNYKHTTNEGVNCFGKKSSISDTCVKTPNIQKVISLISNDINIMKSDFLYENLSNKKNGEILSSASFEARTNKYLSNSSHQSFSWKIAKKWNNVFDDRNIDTDKNEKYGFITNYNIKEHVLNRNNTKQESKLNLKIKESSNLPDINNQPIKSVINLTSIFPTNSIYESLVHNDKKKKDVNDNILYKVEKIFNDADAYTENLKVILAKSQKDNNDFVSISEKIKEIQGPSYNIYDDNYLEIISKIAAFLKQNNLKIGNSYLNADDTTEKITDVESNCNISEMKSNQTISRVEASQTSKQMILVEKEVGCSSFESIDQNEKFTEIRRVSDDAATRRGSQSTVVEGQGYELLVNGKVIKMVDRSTPVVTCTPHDGMVVLTLNTINQPSTYQTTTIAIILPSNE